MRHFVHRYTRPRPRIVSGQQLCYVAVKGCGCVVAAVIPEFCSNRDIGHRVGPWMRRGWDVARMRLGDARHSLQKCAHDLRQPVHQGELFAERTT